VSKPLLSFRSSYHKINELAWYWTRWFHFRSSCESTYKSQNRFCNCWVINFNWQKRDTKSEMRYVTKKSNATDMTMVVQWCITVWLLQGLGSITADAIFLRCFFDIVILLVDCWVINVQLWRNWLIFLRKWIPYHITFL
jgi:hypothetical protein